LNLLCYVYWRARVTVVGRRMKKGNATRRKHREVRKIGHRR
jgi:hypothetical protein